MSGHPQRSAAAVVDLWRRKVHHRRGIWQGLDKIEIFALRGLGLDNQDLLFLGLLGLGSRSHGFPLASLNWLCCLWRISACQVGGELFLCCVFSQGRERARHGDEELIVYGLYGGRGA